MLLGLTSRSSLVTLPDLLSAYAGDTLWALLVFWLFRTIYPSVSILYSALLAISFSFTIEFLQFYHAPWIDHIRSTTLGGLVLGFGFKLSDLACYTVGIGTGVMFDTMLIKYKRQKST